ncbi:MAG TPA: zinc ABC transporter substrate-binding protein [Chitinophagales bacterium]|nr:zinc ABC transporter substrate-binding protein [Chitinophagales bacterium]HRH53670.1 zinc ABC transporter substrate-binding protein [Chitinophagales bacterium]
MKGMRLYFFIAVLANLILVSCKQETTSGNDKLQIVATTGMIGDAVAIIAGDKAEVTVLMGPGVDPHLYKATQGDLNALRSGDIIFYNGLHLEGKMQEVFDRLATTKKVFPVAAGIPESKLRTVAQVNGISTHDPHIWFDVQLWMMAVAEIGKQLSASDPTNATFYATQTTKYLEQLKALDVFVKEKMSSIPETHRTLITSHDAFGYFGAAYGIRVKGLQGISTAAEFGLKDITDMVNMIIAEDIKAVFVESSVSEKSIQAVIEGCHQKNHNIKAGGTLYSDAMGAAGTPEGNYIGMVTHNVEVIYAALK